MTHQSQAPEARHRDPCPHPDCRYQQEDQEQPDMNDNPDWWQVFIEHTGTHRSVACCFRQELEQRRTR